MPQNLEDQREDILRAQHTERWVNGPGPGEHGSQSQVQLQAHGHMMAGISSPKNKHRCGQLSFTLASHNGDQPHIHEGGRKPQP